MDILRSVPHRGGLRVFSKKGDGFQGWAYAKIALDQRIHLMTGKPLAPWRLHHIPCTFRTGLSRIGIAPHVAERAINHAKGGIVGGLRQHRFEAEVNDALELWAAHVRTLVE